MSRTVQCFFPGRAFPAVSTTGARCELDCRHCGGRYLEGMRPATTPEELVALAQRLSEDGAQGLLISGGSTADGRVDLSRFEGAIRRVKNTTDLLVNAHIGLASKGEVEALVACGIDAFSVDVYGSSETIREVLGVSAVPDDYLQVVDELRAAGAPVVAPHICVGVHGGRLVGEGVALDAMAARRPELLVLISFTPTRGTVYEQAPAPSREAVLGVISDARRLLPGTKLLLGCMRDRSDRTWEKSAVDAGLDGIVMPTASTMQALRSSGYRVVERRTCCAFA
jgi:uncharacterized radical SAM superfamily protein